MPSYVQVAHIRAEGITTGMVPDSRVLGMINLCEQLWERMTKQWFVPRAATLELDGTDSDTLHFPVPLIEVTELFINSGSEALSPDLYKVYNARGGTDVEDDRHNPRIKLIHSLDEVDIFTRPITNGQLKFRKGRQNQTVTGTFGYTESDGSVPLGVQRAVTLMVIEKLLNPAVVQAGADGNELPEVGGAAGILVEEKTDGHSRKWQPAGGTTRARPGGLNGISQNPEVRDLLRLYRAPIHIAAPANWTFDARA